MKKRNLKYILCLFLMLTNSILFANKTPPLPKPGQSNAPPPGLPVDGGISLLLISGIAFGVYKLKNKK